MRQARPDRIAVCCVLAIVVCACVNAHEQPTGDPKGLSVPRDEPQKHLIPFKGWGQPVSTNAVKFEEMVRNLPRGQSRDGVRKRLGDPSRRWALMTVTSPEFPIAPGVNVRGPEFTKDRQLNRGQEEEQEMWVYEFDEGKRDISITITPLSGKGSQQKGGKPMSVLRQYQLYFDRDSLEKVIVGMSMTSL